MESLAATPRTVALLVCALVLLLLLPVPGLATALPGALHYWNAEGNALDSVGSNHGAMIGGATFAPSLAGQAFDLTETGARLSMSQAFPPMGVGDDFSVALWMNMTHPSPSWGALFETRRSNYYGFTIAVNPTGMLWIGGRCDNSYRDFNCNGPVSAPGAWHHVAAVFDWVADEVQFYVDGALVDTGPLTGCNGYTLSDKIFLGSASITDSQWDLSGMIDEVQVYNRALDSSEVNTLYGGLAVSVRGPVVYRNWGRVKGLYR